MPDGLVFQQLAIKNRWAFEQDGVLHYYGHKLLEVQEAMHHRSRGIGKRMKKSLNNLHSECKKKQAFCKRTKESIPDDAPGFSIDFDACIGATAKKFAEKRRWEKTKL